MTTQEITILIAERNKLLNSDEQAADAIESKIMKYVRNNFDGYTVDFIIETLTEFGDAPQLVYDDNGMFAVSSHSIGPVVYGNERVEGAMVALVEKEYWEDSIRKALWNYLCRDDD